MRFAFIFTAFAIVSLNVFVSSNDDGFEGDGDGDYQGGYPSAGDMDGYGGGGGDPYGDYGYGGDPYGGMGGMGGMGGGGRTCGMIVIS